MGIYIRPVFNLIDEIRRATINNHNFKIDQWCLYDAEVLEAAARLIRDELEKQRKVKATKEE